MSILIVDDSLESCIALKKLLEREGYKDIKIATSAHDAFRLLGIDDPEREVPNIDVILMDVMMPDINGLDACRQLREKEQFRNIPVLIMTAHSKDEFLESAFAAGAMDYISKPISLTELRVRLRSALTLKQERDTRLAREQELVQLTRQLQDSNEVLQQISILDELTGIANRRHFNMVLVQEWRRSTREATPLSVVLIDIDHFKRYNDVYGHLQGDQCLKKVASTLGSALKRSTDLLARFGGEEFVVLLPRTSVRGAAALAKTLRTAIENLRMEHVGSPDIQQVSISIGVATMIPERCANADALIAAADKALYEAKNLGRNQVRVFHEMKDPAVHRHQLQRN